MGAASKALSVILRIWELCCAAIVCGIVGQYLHYLDRANVSANSRIIYTEVIAGISILLSLILMPPLKYSFYCFIIDAGVFICWMVAFGLLDGVSFPPFLNLEFCGFGDNVNLQQGHGCHSYWYWSYWGYYWGGYWYIVPHDAATQSLVGTAACAEWKACLAFSFIGGLTWLVSAILVSRAFLRTPDTKSNVLTKEQGIYVCTKVPEDRVDSTKMNVVSKASTSVGRWYHKYTRKTGGTSAKGTAAATYSETAETRLSGPEAGSPAIV